MNHRRLKAQLKEISWTGVSQALCALPLAAMGYVGVAQRIFWALHGSVARGMLNHFGVPFLATVVFFKIPSMLGLGAISRNTPT